jgi:hypothetical protein
MEQRAREMGKTSEAAVYRKYINSMKKKTKRMNESVGLITNAVAELEDGLKTLSVITYDSVDQLMQGIAKRNDISPTLLHNQFKAKHLTIPDDWAIRYRMNKMKGIEEATMTPAQKRKDTMLKKKYDKSDMKKSMQKQYGKEEGKQVYFATIRKQAMEGIEDDKYNVSEEGLRDWFGKSSGTTKSGRKVRGWVQVGGKYDGKPCARQPGQKSTPKCVSSSKRRSMSKSERDSAARRKRAADPNQPQKSGAAKPTNVSTDPKRKMKENYFNRDKVVEGYKGTADLSKSHPEALKKVEDKIAKHFGKPKKKDTKESFVNEAKDKKGKGSGSKDACYHKVKSRYSVWPSAYASGALVKCRKVGAANWGNKSKNEGFSPMQVAALESAGMVEIKEGQKCWKGYEKKGTKMMFGKRYNNCVKKKATKEEVEYTNEGVAFLKREKEKKKSSSEYLTQRDAGKLAKRKMAKKDQEKVNFLEPEDTNEAKTLLYKNGHTYKIVLTWRGKTYMVQMFVPKISKPTRVEIEKEIQKLYPDARVMSFLPKDLEPGEPTVMMGEEKRDEYGDIVGGPKISKKQKAKNLAKNEKDEKITRSEEYISELSPATLGSYVKKAKDSLLKYERERAPLNYIKHNKMINREIGIDRASDKLVKKAEPRKPENKRNVMRGASPDSAQSFSQEEYVTEDDMKGMSVKSGHKRPTKSGAGMTAKGVAAYRRRNPGSKLKTAVTGKVKKGSKDAKRRKSYCARSAGQMKKFPKAAKDPNSRLRQARRRWKC